MGPRESLKLPFWQAEQFPPFGPANPKLHRHVVMDVLPIGENDRVGQRVHVSAEDCAVPDENFPAEQSRHVLLVVEAGVVEYFPDAQSSQDAGPMDTLCCPAIHAAQGPLSGP